MTDKLEDTAVLLNQAYNAFDNGDYAEAQSLFQEIADMFPADSPPGEAAATYLRHLQSENLDLLQKLGEADSDQEAKLRQEALARGLEFDLNGARLTDRTMLVADPLPLGATDDNGSLLSDMGDDIEVTVVEDDHSEEWLDEARNAFVRENYDQARELYERVYKATENTAVRQEAERYLRALQPENFILLQKLAKAHDQIEQLTLIREAQARQLTYDLQENELAERAAKIKASIRAEADKKARQLLNDGRTAIDKGDFTNARQLGQQAEQIPNLSAEVQTEITHFLQEVEKQEKALAQASKLLDEAHALMSGEGPDYGAAQKKIAAAREQAHYHPDLQSLHEQAEEGITHIQVIQENLHLGRNEQDPEKAQTYFTQAQQAASERHLTNLQAEASAALAEIQVALKAREDEFHSLINQSKEHFDNQAFAEAKELLEQAIRIAPSGTDLTAFNQLLDKIDSQLSVHNLKTVSQDNIRNRKDFSKALGRLREAQRLSPNDHEIIALIEEAEKLQKEARTVRQTIGLRRVPFHSPNDLEKMDQEWGEFFTSDEFADLTTKARELYWHQAVSDLHDKIQHDVLIAINIGDLPEAIQQSQAAYTEWQDYYENEAKRDVENLAFEARLSLLEAQITDMREAQIATEHIAAQTADIEQAFEQKLDKQAVDIGQQTWSDLQKVPSRLDYALDHHRRVLVSTLSLPVRRLAQSYHDKLEPSLVNIRSYLHTSRLSEAEDELEASRHITVQLKELKMLYDLLAPSEDAEGWEANWLIEPLWEESEELRQRVDDEIRWQNWLEEATQAAKQARYLEAKQNLTRILDANPTYEEALTLKGQVTEAETQYKAMQVALDTVPPNYEQALSTLRGIEYQLGQSTWTQSKLHDVQQSRQIYQMAKDAIANAQNYLDASVYNRAQQEAEQIIHKYAQFSDIQSEALKIKNRAIDNQKIGKELKVWRDEAHTSLREGELEDAIALAKRVLEVKPQDMRMQRIQQQAKKAQTLREEANEQRELGTIESYRTAEAKLTEALRVAYNSSELKNLRDEVRRLRTERQGPANSKKEARQARDAKNLDEALKIIMAALPTSHDYPDLEVELEQLRDEVTDELRQEIWKSVHSKKATVKELEQAQTRWTLLQGYNLLDAKTSDLNRDLERCILVTKAQDKLQANKVHDVVQSLRAYEEEYGNDPDFAAVYATARFATKLLDARECLYPEPVTATRYEQAIQAVQEANKLRIAAQEASKHLDAVKSPRHWEAFAQLEEDQSTRVWGDNLKQRYNILLARQAVNQGQLPVARERLESLAFTHEVQSLRSEIEQIETKMGEAVNWDGSGEVIKKAVHALDSLLPPSRNPAYPPAETLREQILNTLHKRARNRASSGEYDQLASAIDLYDLLVGFNPPDLPTMQTEQSRAERQMRRNMRLLSGQVQDALGNADLSREQCQELLDSVEKVPSKWRQQFRALQNVQEDLQNRLAEIDQVDGLVRQAQGLLAEVHETNDYSRVSNILVTAVQVNPNIFSARSDIGRLRYLVTEHKTKRENIKSRLQPRYKAAQNVISFNFTVPSRAEETYVWEHAQRHLNQLRVHLDREPNLPSTIETRANVQQFVNWGLAWLSTAADFNQEWKKADPDNLYGLRFWEKQSGADDPLDTEHQKLKQAQQHLRGIGDHAIQAIDHRLQAIKDTDNAVAAHEQASKVEHYEEVSQLFQSAINAYDAAIRSLENLPVADSRWAKDLNQRILSFKEDVLEIPRKECVKDEKAARSRRDELEEAREIALEQERQCSESDIACLEIAISHWEEVRNLPTKPNQEAVRHINDLEQKIRKREVQIRTIQRGIGLGIIFTVVIGTLLFMRFAAVGIFAPTPTPTPTPTSTIEFTQTPLPTGTSTTTPSPTITPLPIATETPTLTPPPIPSSTPLPIICQVRVRSWIRDKPGPLQGTGLRILEVGATFIWLESVTLSEGDWYRINYVDEESGQEQEAFIDAQFVDCPSLP